MQPLALRKAVAQREANRPARLFAQVRLSAMLEIADGWRGGEQREHVWIFIGWPFSAFYR